MEPSKTNLYLSAAMSAANTIRCLVITQGLEGIPIRADAKLARHPCAQNIVRLFRQFQLEDRGLPVPKNVPALVSCMTTEATTQYDASIDKLVDALRRAIITTSVRSKSGPYFTFLIDPETDQQLCVIWTP